MKVGDLVTVKNLEYLKEHHEDFPTCTSEMMQYHGCDAIVTQADDTEDEYRRPIELLYLDITGERFVWSSDWVEPRLDGFDTVSTDAIDDMF